MIVVTSLYALARVVGRSMEPRFGQSETAASAPIDGLPDTATSIRYRIGGAFDATPLTFECNVPQEDFVRWATARGLVENPAASEVIWTVNGKLTIDGGTFFYRMFGADSGEHAAYDPKTGRAYFLSHTR